MKNSQYLYYFLAMIFTISCSDDFLDIPPETDISAENFWQTQFDAIAGITGCYDALQPDAYYGFDMYVVGDVRSDNCFAGGDNPNNLGIGNFNIRTTNDVITRLFKQLYRAIGRTNTAINRIELMKDELFIDGKKEALLGEAHFLRALHYFNLVRLYGDVPVVTKETTSLAPEEIFVPRNNESVVYAQIVNDLNISIRLLEGKEQEVGRATVGAAESLLAKVYLTRNEYDKVVTITTRLLDRGYSLLSEFDALFNQENQNNAEIIFAVQYDGGQEGNVFPELVLPTPEASFDFLKFNTPTPNSVQQFENGDEREASSFVERNGTRYLFKWRNGTAFNSADNNIILRYADVLLMRAEALNRTGDAAGAILLLNQIRNRAGLGNYSGEQTQEAVDQAIFQERRVELMYEGHRWFDLKRKGYETARDAIQTAKGIAIAEFELLLPIPQEERDKNELLTQNPGY